MDSTVRFPGVDLDDALSLSEGIDLQRLRGWPVSAAHVAVSDILFDAA